MHGPQKESHPQATPCLSLFRGYHGPTDVHYANAEGGGFTLAPLADISADAWHVRVTGVGVAGPPPPSALEDLAR